MWLLSRRIEWPSKFAVCDLSGVLNILLPDSCRFNPKTDEYERRAEKKQRAPAWCDRVLWKDSSAEYEDGAQSIQLTGYDCSRVSH